MKKLLFFAALLLGFAACNNEENDAMEGNNPGSTVAELITNSGSYDVNAVASLLSQAEVWGLVLEFEYDEGWNNILADRTINDGGANYKYKFYTDGKFEDYTKYYFPLPHDKEYPKVRSWTFDPQTRTLTIEGELSCHLTALSEDNFIVDHIDTWSSAYPRYFRQVFKAQAIE